MQHDTSCRLVRTPILRPLQPERWIPKLPDPRVIGESRQPGRRLPSLESCSPEDSLCGARSAEVVVGTPAYMAPEQALAGDLTAASDIYALGLTLFQCLTGEVPLQEDTAVATLMLRQRSRPPRLRKLQPECPKWLDRLIRLMLGPDLLPGIVISEVIEATESLDSSAQ